MAVTTPQNKSSGREGAADEEGQALAQRRIERGRLVVAGCAGLMVVAVTLGLALGPVAISPWDQILILLHGLGFVGEGAVDPVKVAVMEAIRTPRVVLGAAAGAALGLAGATLQGFFRNPLADPGLIGVSSGGALAAVAVIVLGANFLGGWVLAFGPYALPI
ncbi:MAG: iron chelate uptake ABC transporter family permease subunit, partial [Pseudomonadota bacterium]